MSTLLRDRRPDGVALSWRREISAQQTWSEEPEAS